MTKAEIVEDIANKTGLTKKDVATAMDQFLESISRALVEGKHYEMPILADCQFAALVCGAHPYKIVQSHWHASPIETLFEKLGIDWQAKKKEFEDYLEDVEAGRGETLYDPRLMITSGPGYKAIENKQE